ncbi:Amidohydrolase 2 [Macrophomina phaseolina MS6]|uniref:Amidohydrolase 2 n=1 Tax=Macrophomina phaseolina (strain MS6) TaxID=1126212 RepID=K2S132_MACPH|nr:Amidohydrolase 2 [Macrophomina phaseolina MS6]
MNPRRFGALAAVSMHDPAQAADELRRSVSQLGMFGGLVNDWQSTGADGTGRKYYDAAEYDVFWKTVQELDVPIYFHPRVQVVAGHLGEGIPFNLWRADHWLNKPQKKKTRPSKHDYTYYFKNNVHITTSGNFNTAGLRFCMNEIGPGRCLYAIDTPYDAIEEAQAWWKALDLQESEKEDIGRGNAIRLFKLPLDP